MILAHRRCGKSQSEKKYKFDTSRELLGISLVILISFPKHSKMPAAKQKLEGIINRVAKKVSLAYNIEEASLTTKINSTISKNNINKDHDLNSLMYEINKIISVTDSYCHKLQMLTLAIES